MGSICCCLREEDFRDYINPNNAAYRNCMCLGCFLQNFMHLYASIFQRGDVHSIPSSVEGAASLTSTQSLDNSFEDTFHSPPRPLPYDADPRLYRSQQGGIISRREKGSSHLEEETAPLRSSNDVDSGSLNAGGKWNELDCVEGSKKQLKSLQKLSLAKTTTGVAHVDSYSSFEDEDVCPTCLEEYTPENPKIMTKCSHHFHLGCIYEWMERSDSCPVCGKVMEFNETT